MILLLVFLLGFAVNRCMWQWSTFALRARIAEAEERLTNSVELTQAERTVLILNLAEPVKNQTGLLDEGELKSIFGKLLGVIR